MNLTAKPRKEMTPRVDLSKAIPLEAPLCVFIDPTTYCNFECVFCQTAFLQKNKPGFPRPEHLPLELFRKVVDDLAAFPHPVRQLRLYGQGEPLVHPDFAEMAAYAVNSGHANSVMTLSNGALFTPALSQKIIATGIHEICISIDGLCDQQFKLLVKRNISFAEYYDNLAYLHSIKGDCTLRFTVQDNLLADDGERERCREIFGGICDSLTFGALYDWGADGLANIAPENAVAIGNIGKCADKMRINPETALLPIHAEIYHRYLTDGQDRLVCPMIFYALNVNSNGKVSICCADFPQSLLCGDVRKESLSQIWHGERLHMYRERHLSGKREQFALCRDCHTLRYAMNDNIDDCRDELLQRLRAD